MFARKIVFLWQIAKDREEQHERLLISWWGTSFCKKNYPLSQPDQNLSKARVKFFHVEIYALSSVVTIVIMVLSFLAKSLFLV